MVNNKTKSTQSKLITNERQVKQVRLIIEGEEPKLISSKEALNIASEKNLDLVIVNNKSDVPYVKVMDYQKYTYEQKKKQKNNRKNNKQSIKEVRITAGIADNDLKVKAKTIDRILGEGDKVNISIRYPGRMIKLVGQGYDKIKQILDLLNTNYKIERDSKITGNTISIIIKP